MTRLVIADRAARVGRQPGGARALHVALVDRRAVVHGGDPDDPGAVLELLVDADAAPARVR